jgi:hypothetical protein
MHRRSREENNDRRSTIRIGRIWSLIYDYLRAAVVDVIFVLGKLYLDVIVQASVNLEEHNTSYLTVCSSLPRETIERM